MRTSLLCLGAAAMLGVAPAQTVSTDPVGVLSVTAKGNSDTFLSAPLHRTAAFRGTLAGVSGEVLTINSAGFAQDAFKDTHFVLIASGAKEGRWYSITGNTATSLSIELGAENLAPDAGPGTEIQIIPFWTLNTLFPEGQGLKPSPTFLPQTSLLLPDQARPGIQLSAADAYFYYSGTESGGEGWRKTGAPATQLFDDQILPPDAYCIIRHHAPGDTTFYLPGAVQMTSLANLVGTLTSNTPQDNAIAFHVAVPTSLAASLLFESGAFAGSSTIDVPADQLLVFDNGTEGINKEPSAVYYYFLGSTNGGPGWRLKGEPDTIQDQTLVFQPASGYLIRKSAAAQPGTGLWFMRPFYVPQ